MVTKDLFIKLQADPYAKPGHIFLLASPQDYKELEEFFSSHFNTLSYTHDETRFPIKLFKCPKGSMFVRDENGAIVLDKE